MNYQTFYADNAYLILCLVWAVIFVIAFAIHLAVKQLRQRARDFEKDDYKPRESLDSQQYDSCIIQDMINERWRIQAKIRECLDMKYMGSLYWEIEDFGDWYKDRVPDGQLAQHLTSLFTYHTEKAVELRNTLVLTHI